jgi:hypothetical protein
MQKAKVFSMAKEEASKTLGQPKAEEKRTPSAYEDLATLKKTLETILEQNKSKPNQLWLTVSVAKELRGLIETSLKVWEAQKRLEAQYSETQPLTASLIYKYLGQHYPEALQGLVNYLKEHRND